jgi:hypothetical protein
MEPKTSYKIRTREEILAWLQHAREIKERKQREAEEMYAEQQRQKKKWRNHSTTTLIGGSRL